MDRMDSSPWRQLYVVVPRWSQAETTLVTHIAPMLNAAEDQGVIEAWCFIRKPPGIRVRYLPRGDVAVAQARIRHRLEELKADRLVEDLADVVYEPETRAFGGSAAMAAAHRLFHLDTRHVLTYLADAAQQKPSGDHRRELSIMLCSAMLRGAGLDWYEQGAVWDQVAQVREPPGQIPVNRLEKLHADMRRLMMADTLRLAHENSGPVAAGWAAAFSDAGEALAELTTRGRLRRGLREVLAHQVIFAWNRHGLPVRTQSVIAHTATTVVFGRDPSTTHEAQIQGGTS